MLNIALMYGLVGGFVSVGALILSINFAGTAHIAGLEWMGFLIMVLAMSSIFFGVKRYRDSDLAGDIKFGTAFMFGMTIAVIASIAYVTGWEIYFALTGQSFIAQNAGTVIGELVAQGASDAEIADVTAQMEAVNLQYADPLYRLPLTFVEIFPVGLLVTIAAALLLRNPRFMPVQT